MPETKRQTEFDVLRLLAILAVIAMHAGGNAYLSSNFDPRQHSMFVAAIVWCVPVFFLISGRFFLDPQRHVTIKKIWNKHIRRIIVVFVAWSSIYALYYIKSGAYDGLNIWGIFTQWIEGPYHFWYLYAIIGLYAFTPLPRKITENEKVMLYFLALYAVANIIGEYLVYLPKLSSIFCGIYDKLLLGNVAGYIGYYVLGYCVFHYRNAIGQRIELAIYIIGAICLVATILLEGQISPELQEADFVKQYLKPNVILFSTAIYVFFVKRVSQINFSEKAAKAWGKLTELSFGVYILHALVNEMLALIPIAQPVAHPYIILFALMAAIYLLSLVLTWLIRKIPFVGEKIT